jgi:hypothetical protein
VSTFKKFLNKLNKREDENLLNKKKRREEKEQGGVKTKEILSDLQYDKFYLFFSKKILEKRK